MMLPDLHDPVTVPEAEAEARTQVIADVAGH